MKRGVIFNRLAATRVNDFSGLRWGAITPTDVDMLVEFGDQCFVIGEIKARGVSLPNGQRLALERVAQRIGKQCLLLLIWHDVDDDSDIDVATCEAGEFYWDRSGSWSWRPPKYAATVREACDWWRLRCDVDAL